MIMVSFVDRFTSSEIIRRSAYARVVRVGHKMERSSLLLTGCSLEGCRSCKEFCVQKCRSYIICMRTTGSDSVSIDWSLESLLIFQ